MTPESKFPESKYLVDRRFQVKYMLIFALVGAMIPMFFGLLAYRTQVQVRHLLIQEIAQFQGTHQLDLALIDRVINEEAALRVALTVGTAVFMAFVLALMGMFITYRVAAPIHVMTRYISALAEGRYLPYRPFRKGTELVALFEQFHRTIELIRERELQEAERIEAALTRLKRLATTDEDQEALSALMAVCARKRHAAESSSAPENDRKNGGSLGGASQAQN